MTSAFPVSDTEMATARALRELHMARAEVDALTELLEVHERTSLDQATKLEALLRERDAALSQVQQARTDLLRVFEQAPAAIALTRGPDHHIQTANSEYLKIVGNRDLVGKTMRGAFPDLAGQPHFFDLLDDVFRTGVAHRGTEVPATIETEGRAEEKYFNFVYQPLIEASGNGWGIMIHAVDVTEQVLARCRMEQSTAELRALTNALERSNRELDQFAYVASHDLKAPLRGIANLAQWIQEDIGDKLSGESAEHMGLLHGRVQRMEALIDGVLTYSRAARVREKPDPVDTGALVREIIDLISPSEDVRISIMDEMPIVSAERIPLQQVLMNLLSNALKYGRGDGPIIDVGAREVDGTQEFFVRDNGPGIAPEFHDRVWALFQTLEARDKVEGTGIGLAVVRKVVESRGGRAWLESKPGEGATFRFTWPNVTQENTRT